jgi:hypothetical protein
MEVRPLAVRRVDIRAMVEEHPYKLVAESKMPSVMGFRGILSRALTSAPCSTNSCAMSKPSLGDLLHGFRNSVQWGPASVVLRVDIRAMVDEYTAPPRDSAPAIHYVMRLRQSCFGNSHFRAMLQ